MGLFSKKPKELVYDAAECQRKKECMRNMFNEAVPEGDSYEVLHATQTSTKFERGFVFDTNTTSFYHYILGYRRSDDKVVLVQVDRDLTQHSDAFFVDMDAVVGASYNPKYTQACLLYKKGYPDYAEILDCGYWGHRQQDHVRHPQHRTASGTGSIPGLFGETAQSLGAGGA